MVAATTGSGIDHPAFASSDVDGRIGWPERAPRIVDPRRAVRAERKEPHVVRGPQEPPHCGAQSAETGIVQLTLEQALLHRLAVAESRQPPAPASQMIRLTSRTANRHSERAKNPCSKHPTTESARDGREDRTRRIERRGSISTRIAGSDTCLVYPKQWYVNPVKNHQR